MNSPTSMLSEEHQNILKVVNALIHESGKLETDGKINKDFFLKAIDFIETYADKFHHAKEENILFKELIENEQMHCNPIPQMLHEHETGRNYVSGMKRALKENNTRGLIENSRGYAYLLQDHIYKEDNILYPMADEALDEETQASILIKFQQVEESNSFKGINERYLLIADELSEFERAH